MKLIIIQPATVFKDGTPYKTPRRWIMGLALPYVAALTPDWVDVELLDDRLSEINYEGGYDMVALSVAIASSSRAYYIADEFRYRSWTTTSRATASTLESCSRR
ncbi:MAG: hypothetical protein WA666_09170 [Nitrospirota bacterium]